MKNIALILGFTLALFTSYAKADVVSLEYTDPTNNAVVKDKSPFYINPQGTINASVTAGVGRKIVLEVKDLNGTVITTKTKNRVENTDTFIYKGVTYSGAQLQLDKLADGQYTLSSAVFSGEVELSRQNNALVVDTQTPTIVGDFYWLHFGSYAYKHSDNKFILSTALGSDAGFPSIDPGTSGFSHGTFSSEYLDGPKAGTFHAKNIPLLLTGQGKLIIGNGAQNSINFTHLPDNTANQMRLTYTIFNKVGASSSRTVDVYIATRKSPKPEPYGIFTGVASQLDNLPAFTGFVPYVAGMAITSNPVRMIYRAPKEFFLGGGGDAEIYGAWLNGSRKPNKVVHTDAQFIYFDLTGSTDGKQYGSMQHYTRDVSTWRTHFFTHDLVVPSNLAPPKSTGFSFFIQGKNEWRNSNVSQHITKFDTAGATDLISKIRVQVEPRLYDQRFNYDFGGTRKGTCIIPATATECILDTALPFPGDDVNQYHNRHMITNLTNTLFSQEIVSTWQYDGSIAELAPATMINDNISKTITFSVVDEFKDRINSVSTVRVMDAFAINSKGVKTKLPRTLYVSNSIDSTQQLFTGTYNYAALADGIYRFEAYVEDGFSSASLRNKNTHPLMDEVVIDTTPPSITTNIKAQTIKSLPAIVISANDLSPATIKSVILSGGIDAINMSIPTVTLGGNKFRPEHVYIKSSDTSIYTMTIVAADSFGNETTFTTKFYYSPVYISLPEIKQPALASALKSEDGMPSNVIQTPQIKNPIGELAQGNHDVTFSVLPTAGSGMMINGELISPGESRQFTVNLSQTNHRLTFEAYPAVSGQELTNQFEIHMDDVRVSLCPTDFELQSQQCIFIAFAQPELKCNSPFSLKSSTCEMEVIYDPSTTCVSGYNLFGVTCRGTYTVAALSSCNPNFSNVNNSTCEKIQTKPLKVCADSQTVQDSFCKESNGTVVPQKAYCDGLDISGGSFDKNGKHYTYKPDWNACQITEQEPAIQTCQVGTLTNGNCQVSDEYVLNMQCPFGYNRDELLCKRIEIIDPIKSCDDGYSLLGNICSKIDIAPFVACPATHYLNEGRCHLISPTTINCPSTYSWTGTICKKEEQVPASPICSEGQTFNGTECQKDEYVPGQPVCSTSYVEENGKCVNKKTSDAIPVCPVNFTWDIGSDSCLKAETQAANITCAAGYSWDGISCKKPEKIAATGNCSAGAIASGYTWTGTSCSKPESMDATVNCPLDKPWNGTSCQKVNNVPATLNCAVSYTWDVATSSCKKEENQPATPKCAALYTSNGSICEKNESQPATGSCSASDIAAGYSWNGISCQKNETTTASVNCPSDKPFNGTTCSATNTMQATLNCPAGQTWNGSDCSKIETISATPNCLVPGQSWNGSACAKTESMAATPNCLVPGESWNGSACTKTESMAATPNCLVPGESWNGSVCTKTETIAATSYCSSVGESVSGSLCVKSDSIAATPICGSGKSWTGTTCASTETEPAIEMTSCPTIFGDTCGINPMGQRMYPVDIQESSDGTTCTYRDPEHCGSWSTTRPVDKTYICMSPGYSLTSNSSQTCARTTTSPPVSYSCPPNAGWTVSGATCNRSLTTPVLYKCPSTGGWALGGSNCTRTVTSVPTYSCPSTGGWALGGSNCTRTVTSVPTYSCPSTGGWALGGSNCTRTVTSVPTYSCPSTGGWALGGSDCTRTVTSVPTYSCPSTGGWTRSGNTCSQTVTQLPTYSCQPTGGWTVQGSNCNRTLSATTSYTCPNVGGWVKTGSQCNRTLTSPQTYECPSTGSWVLNVNQCGRTLTVPQTYSCPPIGGWVLNASTCTQTLNEIPTYTCPLVGGWSVNSNKCNRTLVEATVFTCPSTGGWALDGSDCNRTLTKPNTFTCPSTGGWVLDSNNCNRTVVLPPASYTCIEGEILDGKICTAVTIKDPDSYNCDSGWVVEGALCHLITTSPVGTYECDPDWTLDGNICRITRTKAETRTCFATHTKIDDNNCFFNVPATSVGSCDVGWTSNATNCTKGLTHPVKLSCNPTYDLIASQCHTTITEPVNVICQPDEELRGGKCVIIKKHSPKPVCASPYALENPTSCKNEIVIPAFN